MRYTNTILIFVLFLSACDRLSQNNTNVESDSEYLLQTTTALTFTSPKPFTWNKPSGNYKLPNPVSIDIDQLPEKPLELLDFKPFKKPVTQTDFDFEKLPSDYFHIDSLPEEKLTYTLTTLGNPKIIDTPKPEIPDSAQTNILVINKDEFKVQINDILEDDQDNTWIASSDGLFHFDGEKCYHYGSDQGLSFYISKIWKDDRSRLWLSSGSELIILDIKSGLIKIIKQAEGKVQYNFTSLLQGSKDEIWAGTYDDGIYIINENKGTIKHFTRRHKLSGNNIWSMMKDSKGRIWIGEDFNGVDIIDQTNHLIRHCKDGIFQDNTIYSLFESEPGVIWIGTGEYATVLDMNLNTISHLNNDSGINFSYVNEFSKDIHGNIWLASNNGLYIVDMEKARFKKIPIGNDANNSRVICVQPYLDNKIWLGTSEGMVIMDVDQKVTFLNVKKDILAEQFGQQIEDRDGNFWVGTDKGVYILDAKLQSKRFLEIFGGVQIIFEDSRGKIWMGGIGDQGLFVYDKKNKTLRNFTILHGLIDNSFFSFMEDSSGKIWMTFPMTGGIMTIHIDDYYMQILNLRISLNEKPALSFLEKENGDIWISTGGKGIISLDVKASTYIEINDTSHKMDVIFLNKMDESNRIWCSTPDGIGYIDATKSEFTRFTQTSGFAGFMESILLYHNKNKYIFSKKGVYELIPSDTSQKINQGWTPKKLSKFRGFLEIQGVQMPNFPFYSDKGTLWCSDTKRISIIAPSDTITPHHETFITGIDVVNQPVFFNDKTSFKDALKKSQAMGIKTDSLLRGRVPSSEDDENMLKKDIKWNGVEGNYNLPVNLQLPYYLNYLTFHFSCKENGHFDHKEYRYMLRGTDNTWNKLTEKPESKNYLNLSPGNYSFMVVSKGYDGKWSAPAEFTFAISPPWWKTWWAYLLYLVIFSIASYAVAVYRSRNLKRSNTLLEEKVRIRTKALHESINDLKSTQAQLIQSEKMASLGELTAGIAHEIQNPLNFVNNFSEINKELIGEMKDEIEKGNFDEVITIAGDIEANEEKINHHGKRADAIVKGMLAHSSKSTGQKEPTDINALCDEYLRLSFHGLRAKDNSFNATMNTEFDPNIPKLRVVPQDIGRVFLNIINNAFYAVNERKILLDLAKQRGDENLKDLDYQPTVTITTQLIANTQLPNMPTSQNANSLIITIKDNGLGIPEHIKEKIFQPFFTTKPTGQGTGLGLSLSYDIVKAHGGELKLETKEDKGTNFIIQLPVI